MAFRSESTLLVTAGIAGVIAFASPLYANWGGEAGGSVATGTFRPVGTGQVEMLKEDLVINLYRDRAKVEVNYVLHNKGGPIEVKAGFPSLGVKIEDEPHREIEDYSILADGKSLAFDREKGDPAAFRQLFDKEFLDNVTNGEDPKDILLLDWLVSTVHFEKDETKRIRIDYESLYAYSDGGASEDSTYLSDRFSYLLSTAAAWSGPIREGRVTIKAATVDASKLTILPEGRFHRSADGTFMWEFRDLKPSMADNIKVNLNDHFSTIFNYGGGGETADGSRYSFEDPKYYFDSHNYTASDAQHMTVPWDYFPKNVRDYDRKTEWRAEREPGIDEALTLGIRVPVHISQIGIVPGCGEDKQAWFSHSRIKELEVTVNGKYSATATLPDEYISFGLESWKGYELVNLPAYPGDATEIEMTIRSVYPGAKNQITCISEILVRQQLKSKPDVHGAGI
jgi:hypothetical protein